jgi:uncharacterized DUF497 family protein
LTETKTSPKQKHGVKSFDQAITAFDDPYALIERDEEHSSPSEIREALIGESGTGGGCRYFYHS